MFIDLEWDNLKKNGIGGLNDGSLIMILKIVIWDYIIKICRIIKNYWD